MKKWRFDYLYHDGCGGFAAVTAIPTISDIRAFCFFAHLKNIKGDKLIDLSILYCV